MSRWRAALIMAFLLLPGATFSGEVVPGLSTLRDIRDPLPAGGLPPFTVTATVLFLVGIWIVVRILAPGKGPSSQMPVTAPAFSEGVETLVASYRRGEIAVEPLLEGLSHILRQEWISTGTDSLTSAEILHAARDRLNRAEWERAENFFFFSDRVRFGGYDPNPSAIEHAIADVRTLFGGGSEENA